VTTKEHEMILRPVGVAYDTDRPEVMRIEIVPQYSDALLHIEHLERVTVLYLMNRFSEKERRILQVHPQGDKTKPLQGVFALRSPMRPNPIGVTEAELVRREGNNLFVKGLDAFDGSPVIDLKSGKK